MDPAGDDDAIDRTVRQGVEALDRERKDGTVTVLECPECNQSDLSYVAGLETGHQYRCPHCGYQGAFVIERERTPAELRRIAGLDP